MDETKEMRDARHQLQLLSASDPAVRANMVRHMAALNVLVTGQRRRDRREGEPYIGASFEMASDGLSLCAAVVRKGGIQQVYAYFDVDDAAGPPVGLGVLQVEGEHVMHYGDCRLWCPTNDGRALIVPTGDGYAGYFAFRPGMPLRLVEAALPGDFEAGARRADLRLRRLLNSKELRDAQAGAFMHVLRNGGEDIYADTRPLAA